MDCVDETELPATEGSDLPARQAGRVVVLDPDGRILLFRYDDPPPNGSHWSTPGGGLEPGEGYHAGAQRELIEETGWDDVLVLPPMVRERTIVMEYAGRIVRQTEHFFLARVTESRRPLGDVAAMHVSDGIDETRWWTLAELDATAEKIWPDGLPDLVRKLL
jgi:ADP-ribose pyrophosphatase YjhB (NUDIX family)